MKIYNFFTKEYSTVEELFNAFFKDSEVLNFMIGRMMSLMMFGI